MNYQAKFRNAIAEFVASTSNEEREEKGKNVISVFKSSKKDRNTPDSVELMALKEVVDGVNGYIQSQEGFAKQNMMILFAFVPQLLADES